MRLIFLPGCVYSQRPSQRLVRYHEKNRLSTYFFRTFGLGYISHSVAYLASNLFLVYLLFVRIKNFYQFRELIFAFNKNK